MWNHGVPYVLKQLIDVISQPGMVFGFDPERGYSGLLTGRTAVVIYTSAVYGHGVSRDFGVDYQVRTSTNGCTGRVSNRPTPSSSDPTSSRGTPTPSDGRRTPPPWTQP